MKKHRHVVLLCILTVAAVCVFLTVLVVIRSKTPLCNRMFAEITEFSKLEEYALAEAPPLSGVPSEEAIAAQYCKTVSFEGCRYRVYAFVFAEARDAQALFTGMTGRDADLFCSFSLSGNYFFHTRYVAYYDRNLYVVEGGSERKTVAFISWLNSTFSLDFTNRDAGVRGNAEYETGGDYPTNFLYVEARKDCVLWHLC